MSALRRALARLGGWARGHRRADADLRTEMETHLALAAEELVRRGATPAEALRLARAASGGLTQATELVRAQRGLPWLEQRAADLRFAMRHFRRTPLATTIMLLVLSLGLGSTVVLFTLLGSLLTMPAPGIAPDPLQARIRGTHRSPVRLESRQLSWPEVLAYRARSDLFGGVAAWADESAIVTVPGGAAPVAVSVTYVTPEYFPLLGIVPATGSAPAGDADPSQLTHSPSALISDAMWREHFGAAADIVGRTVLINDMPVVVTGVAPPGFIGTDGGNRLTLWLPLAAYPLIQKRSTALLHDPEALFLSAAARLQPGVPRERATAAVAGIAQRLFAPRSDSASVRGADVVPLLAGNGHLIDRGDLIISVAAAGGFALLILLITCTNVSALMVGLAVARRREIAVRLSLGAPRRRVIAQLLTESVLLAGIAAVLALMVTVLGVRFLGAALQDVQLIVDWRVVLATGAVALLAGLLFGVSPALHATRGSTGAVLRATSGGGGGAHAPRLQRALVVAQVALTQPLLVGLGAVIVATMADARRQPSAGVADRIAEIEVDPWASRVSPADLAARITAAVARVAAMPGVVAAMPMQMGMTGTVLAVDPADRVAGIAYGSGTPARLVAAPRGYFDALGIRIVRGRGFDDGEFTRTTDDPSRPMLLSSVIIGSDLARRLWGPADPVGRRLVTVGADGAPGSRLTVVGIVDAAQAGRADANGEWRIHVPYAPMNSGVLARTAAPALPMLSAIRQAVAAETVPMPVVRVQTMAQREALARRTAMRTTGAVAAGGLLALLLSAVGLYAVVSFTVGQRTREIGIRTALGASTGRVVRRFFLQGMTLGAFGLVLGLPLSILATRLIADALHLPLERSPLLGTMIGILVLVVASVAAWIPARRASRVDPIIALRSE